MSVITLTGASGDIGSTLRGGVPRAGETWRLLDVRPVPDPAPHEQPAVVDLSDLDATTEAFAGSDAVVHLAAVPTERAFDEICRHNLVAGYHVFEAARRCGVRRVVFASTMHVTGFYPWGQTIGPDAPVRPDTLYGVSKAYGEALGRLYADKYGLEVVVVRIGNFLDRPGRWADLPIWLSPADCVRLFRACLDATGITYLPLYGVSANTDRFWTEDGWDTVGYRPVDDARQYADGLDDGKPRWQGMEFTEPGFGRT